jgi:hypothetical protein
VDIAETEGISLRTSLITLNGENAEFIETLLEQGPREAEESTNCINE